MLFNLFPPDEFSYWWPYALGGLVFLIILFVSAYGSEDKEKKTQ